MHRHLLEYLVCPACLPLELSLEPHPRNESGDEILDADLLCPGCRKKFPVEEGVAVLLSNGKREHFGTYEGDEALSSYLWSHYSDFWDDPDGPNGIGEYAALLSTQNEPFLDIGCAVGRMAFEMARRSPLVVGIDRSFSFVRTARRLYSEGVLVFPLKMEGYLSESRTITLPAELRRGRFVEFIVADALALPFRKGTFGGVASFNLLDRVSSPLKHLREASRVARGRDGELIVSDPFSWSIEYAQEREWIGGLLDGPFSGAGKENLRRLLETSDYGGWTVEAEGELWWKIRRHRNCFEVIRSDYLVGRR